MSLARGACTAYMDADFAIDPRAVSLLLEGLRTSDVVIGSRALPDSMVESTYALRSVMGGPVQPAGHRGHRAQVP